jgi:hypothetical protein
LNFSGLIWSSLFIGLTACSDATSLNSRLPPSLFDLRPVSVDSGGVLKIAVVVSNSTGIHLQMANSPECSFAFRIFADSTGQPVTDPGGSCPSSTSTTDLAPGHSVTLIRMVAASDLAQYAPGMYGVNVSVRTTAGASVTAWAGTVRLPLSSTP